MDTKLELISGFFPQVFQTFDSINNLLLRINSIENTIDTLNKNINNTFNFIYNPNFGFT